MNYSSQPPALRIEDITVVVEGKTVLDSLRLQIEPTEVIAVQGTSGAGKSTLLATIAGLLRAESGQIWIDGERVDALTDRLRSAHRLERLGVVFQSDELLPELSLGENITLPLQLTGHRQNATDLLTSVRHLIDELDIAELMGRPTNGVSGGQLQRAAIARALVHNPSLVLADEPTASLDESTARTAVQMLIRLTRDAGAAAILVTHDPLVASMCDRIVRLNAGQVHESHALAQDS